MKNTWKLTNPITINGKEVSEVSYDADKINGLLFAEADARRRMAAGLKNMASSLTAEFDTALHLYLGFAAIVAVNPTYDFSDVERISGPADIVRFMKVGRNFILMSEDSRPSNSDEQSETTASISTQA